MKADNKQELQEVLAEWKGVFKKHGLKMSREKTEVMWVGQQTEDLNISLDGKEINQVGGFVYLGGMIKEDGHSEVEMRCRIQQGANARGKVEGVMLDRNILIKLKSPESLRYNSMPVSVYGDSGVDRTTIAAASLVMGSSNIKNKKG